MKYSKTTICVILLSAYIFLPILITHAARIRCQKKWQQPKYHKVASCASSGFKILAQGFKPRLDDCTYMAGIYKAMAFSFREKDEAKNSNTPNCILYGCPELDEMIYIKREPGFDYYTQFADPLPSINTTCVPRIGIVELVQVRANYSTAVRKCRQRGAHLAEVTSAAQTTAFSQLLKDVPMLKRKVYVGLYRDNKTSEFVTTNKEPLSCFEFRAWAPGQPYRRSKEKPRDCVVLSDQETWHTVSCDKKLFFLCQLFPKGPVRFLTTEGTPAADCEDDIEVLSSEPVTDDFSDIFKAFFKAFHFSMTN